MNIKLLLFSLATLSPFVHSESLLDVMKSGASSDNDFGVTLINADDRAEDDIYGDSVMLDGNRAVVGAPGVGIGTGAVYVFDLTEQGWQQTDKLVADDGEELDLFGGSVALDGNRIAVGARKHNQERGAVYVFELGINGWEQRIKLTPNNTGILDRFGQSIAMDVDVLLIGAPGVDNTANRAGSVFLFEMLNGEWIEIDQIFASDGAEDDSFGSAVDIETGRALVSAVGDDGVSGSVYYFEKTNDIWTEQQKIVAQVRKQNDAFGTSISLSGDRILIGAPGVDFNFSAAGAAYTFIRDKEGWLQERKFFDVGGLQNEAFGASVSLSGDRFLIGSVGSEINAESTQSSWVYQLNNDTWQLVTLFDVNDDNNGIDDKFYGTAVSLSGDRVIIGSIGFDDFIGGAFINHIDKIFINEFE